MRELVSQALEKRTGSARITYQLGVTLGKLLEPGDVVALIGELGAGKTQLVRGICEGAAVPEDQVASPTFAIVAAYQGRIRVYHADLYRIADYDELYGTGFLELVGGDGATLVEWAERIPEAVPADALTIRMAHVDDKPNTRLMRVTGTGDRHSALLREWLGR